MNVQETADASRLHLLEGFGVELEYMIVDRDTLKVCPVADQVLTAVAGQTVSEAVCGELRWSNELALHVIELKTNGPVSQLPGLFRVFQRDVQRINELLRPLNACLMGSAVHPFMDPLAETHLWPHGDKEIYQALDRAFGCRGHGWSNLQAAHLNLSFYNEEEFLKLHAAVRLILPLIPAIAAASPYADGRDTGWLDGRLQTYSLNCARVPTVTGQIIPEPISSIDEYHARILDPMYADIRPFDAAGILRHEWLNARGAIARFERSTIEIRLVDAQECPLADMAVLMAIAGAIRFVLKAPLQEPRQANSISTGRLRALLGATMYKGQHALFRDRQYLRSLGILDNAATAREIWKHLGQNADGFHGPERAAFEGILRHGSLATRIRNATGLVTMSNLKRSCRLLCECLRVGKMLK
jgi:gamma-glutamyl:cysteine ligase YbdK (ATP-grasp superfamily)